MKGSWGSPPTTAPVPSVPRCIPAGSLHPQPWKNGQGSTRQIAAFPPDAGPSDFVWRVSAADVSQASPFSRWDGVDRHLVITHGNGIRLKHRGTGALITLLPDEILTFPGEEGYACELLDGPVRDCNLMLRRGLASGTLTARHGPCHISAAPGDTLLYCTHGHYHVESTHRSNSAWSLHTGDTLWIPDVRPESFTCLPGTDPAALIHIQVHALIPHSVDPDA